MGVSALAGSTTHPFGLNESREKPTREIQSQRVGHPSVIVRDRKCARSLHARVPPPLVLLQLNPCFGPERQIYCRGIGAIHKPNSGDKLEQTHEAGTGTPGK